MIIKTIKLLIKVYTTKTNIFRSDIGLNHCIRDEWTSIEVVESLNQQNNKEVTKTILSTRRPSDGLRSNSGDVKTCLPEYLFY